jgi:hypothetical protein
LPLHTGPLATGAEWGGIGLFVLSQKVTCEGI